MVRVFARFAVGALLASASLPGCKKPADKTGMASTATAPSAVASVALAPGAVGSSAPMPVSDLRTPPGEGEPLSELDPCLIGAWKSTGVIMKMATVNAEGGSGALLTVGSTGISALEFTPMQPISSKTPEFTLNFRYGGRALATLNTPKRNVIEVTRAVYTALTVTAGAKPEHGEPVVIFENKLLVAPPAGSGAHAGLAARPGSAAPARSAAPALAGSAALPGFAGIAQNPVFSSSRYSCADSALTLFGKDEVSWRFVKTDLYLQVPPHY